jgi:hypothetical protein
MVPREPAHAFESVRGRRPAGAGHRGVPGRRLRLRRPDRPLRGPLHAVETFNQNSALTWPDQAERRYALDALLARGHRLQVAVGDDAHWNHRWDRFGAWVQVRAERLEPDLLLQALKAGAYFSTQGPRIDEVRVEAGLVHVACSAARAIALTGIRGWRSDVALGDPTRARRRSSSARCSRRSGASR